MKPRRSVATTHDDGEEEDAVDVRTTISVAVRKRPRIRPKEERENDVVRRENETSLTVYAPKMRVDLTPVIEPSTFTFDHVFDERTSNEDVYYNTTRPLLNTVKDGGSAVVFAFGQTGSGKTYTMLGHAGLDPGIYSLAVRDMLGLVQHMRLTASFYEVYGSKLFDLLNDRTEVKVLQDEYKNIHIVGLRERPVDSSADLTDLMKEGQVLRACGTTSANDRSSRSHAVLVLNLRETRNDAQSLFGRMTFVDLAGSERAIDTTDADKKTRREGAEINKSLLALKECIRAMGMKKRHIPFRGSKLTQILRESFIGNCQTCVIANVSPCQSHCEDTLNTLRYADRIKSLKSNAVDSEVGTPVPCHNCGLPIFIGDRHICRKVVTQCPHCRQEFDKEKLENHLTECKDVPLRCPHCNERVLQGDLPKHNRRCIRFPIRCGPCGETVPRNLMEKHVASDCLQSKGNCRYCRGQFIRHELAVHEESCGHMQICCQYCLMVVKKSKMDSHLSECTSNPVKKKPQPPSESQAFRRIPSSRSYTANVPGASPSPPTSLQPLRRRPSARSRSPGTSRGRSPTSHGRSPSSMGQAPMPPSPSPSTSLKPRQTILSADNCRYCAKYVPPPLLDAHLSSDCQYVPVKCPYEMYGCMMEVARAKVASHVLESMAEHLHLVQKYAETMSKENNRLKGQVADLMNGTPSPTSALTNTTSPYNST